MNTIRAARSQELLVRNNARNKILFFIVAIALTWLGFSIRLHNLGGDSLWLDEQLTLQTARLGIPAVFQGARDHPPMIYLLTSLVIRQFGETEFTARLVSLFAGTLAIPLIILLGKVMRRPSAGLWAGLFLVFSPVHLKYTQESRHYALLMTVSLVTYILLYLAMTRARLRYWLAFGLFTALNLYVHYGAFIVLATQLILVLPWTLWQLSRRSYRRVFAPAAALALAFLLYLPWMSNFLSSLDINVGAGSVSDTGGMASTGAWMREAFISFGMYYDWLPYAMLALALAGLLILLLQRDFLAFALLAAGILIPFLWIQVGAVARGAFARYLIYILPLYLFSAAVTPATILAALSWRLGRRWALSLALVGALLFCAVGWSPIRREHQFIQDDWRGIVRYLDQNANSGDVLAAFSLRGNRGFNNVGSSLPYYLDRRAQNHYLLLHGNNLRRSQLLDLQASTGAIWIIIFDPQFVRQALPEIDFRPVPFQAHLYVMPYGGSDANVVEELIAIYEELLPLASSPSPRCYLEKDLALLYAHTGDFISAEPLLSSALDSCSDQFTGFNLAYDADRDIPQYVYEGAILDHLQHNAPQEARRIASTLYQLDPHNPLALDALTIFNLQEMYNDGQASENLADPTVPFEVKQFVMPQTGDAGDALLVHAPNSLSFPLELPEQPLMFHTRVAMDPASWHWGGDGALFTVSVTTEDGATFLLAEQPVSNDEAGRRWHDMDIELAPFAGRAITITLQTEPGPAADFTADWGGWESPRIMYLAP